MQRIISRLPNRIIRTGRPEFDKDEYTLAFIEFDDEGWFYDRSQMDRLSEYLESREGEHFLLTVFVHGWAPQRQRSR